MFKFIVLFIIVSCAQTADIFKSKDGFYTVTGQGSDKAESVAIARRSSKKHCDKKEQVVMIESEKTTYHGKYSESTNSDLGTLAKVGGILTGDYYKSNQVGGAIRGENNYKTILKFKCD